MSLVQRLFKNFIRKRGILIGKQILPYIENNEKILDFGCGDMAVSEFISKKRDVGITGIDVVDYNSTDLENIVYGGGRLPFKDNHFDLVFASFVLHHTDDPAFYFKELSRVSKKKIILIEDTFVNRFEKAFTYGFDWLTNHLESLNVKIPFNFRSVNEWKTMVKTGGLKLKKMKRFYPNIVPFIPTRNVLMVIEKEN